MELETGCKVKGTRPMMGRAGPDGYGAGRT